MGSERKVNFLPRRATSGLSYLPEALPFPDALSPWAPSLPSEALGDPQICYILDSILFLYGIILTLLYCRLKVRLGRCGEGRGQGQAGGRGTVVSA